jgi:hypothetical protein
MPGTVAAERRPNPRPVADAASEPDQSLASGLKLSRYQELLRSQRAPAHFCTLMVRAKIN